MSNHDETNEVATNPNRCSVSPNGRHGIEAEHAGLTVIDEQEGCIDVDVVCTYCGASGHCVAMAEWARLEWTMDDPPGAGPRPVLS